MTEEAIIKQHLQKVKNLYNTIEKIDNLTYQNRYWVLFKLQKSISSIENFLEIKGDKAKPLSLNALFHRDYDRISLGD